ncbi:MAG: YaaR family protein, partial [Spirochaetaceae bacterium]|nr:YaaR family protein [Spirochaetaceae bacterium]
SVLEGADEKAEADSILSTVSLPVLDGTETVEGLLDDVHVAGEALKRDPVFGPMNGYKKAVRRFLRYVIENGLETDEALGIRNPRTMQQKKYVIIRVVDERLESLAAHVLKNQIDQLEILRRIDEIHGMLVDITG